MDLLATHLDAVLYGAGLVVLLLLFMPFSPMMIDILLLPRGLQLGIYRHRHKLWALVWAAALVLLVRGMNGIAEPSGVFAPLVTTVQSLGILGAGDPVWIKVVAITAAVMAMMFWSGYVPYVMTPPADPQTLDIAEADKLLSDDDMVLGVVNGDDIRAYPRDSIARPHFFEDTVGGTPLTVSYCILCNSGMAFRSELHGKKLALKCVTAYNNNIIYHDPASDNYIQQLDGEVILGPDVGTRLETHPVVQARWADWKALHPTTKLYYAPEQGFRDKMVGAMLQMMIPIRKLVVRKTPWHRIRGKLDTRLPAMAYVHAVEIGGERKAYAEADLKTTPVVNDTVGGTPLAVMYDAGHDVADIFSRRVGGRELTFEPSTDGGIARDRETGSTWDITGTCVGGELAGQRLARISHYNKLFWFSWPLFKPDTAIGSAA